MRKNVGMPPVTRIAMWSGPRNISTALMRSFENRDDSVVVDEPLYGFYLKNTGIKHPGGDQIITSMDCDWRSVADALCHQLPEDSGKSCRVYYQKHMTHHILEDIELGFTDTLLNCFLIRQPRRIIASYARVRPDFSFEELGFPQQWRLFERVADKLGVAPPVIDSARVLREPEKALRALCDKLGVSFSERMLQWPKGSRDSDGVWGPHWYTSVEASTGFDFIEEKPLATIEIPARYEAMCEQAERIYANLYQYALCEA